MIKFCFNFDILLHIGPLCYLQPPLKSNKKIILNAILHTCLAGPVNNKSQLEAIRVCTYLYIDMYYDVIFYTCR